MHVCLNHYVRYLLLKKNEVSNFILLLIHIFVRIVHKVFMMKSEYIS